MPVSGDSITELVFLIEKGAELEAVLQPSLSRVVSLAVNSNDIRIAKFLLP